MTGERGHHPFEGGYIRGTTLVGWVLGGKKNLGGGD